MKIIVGGTFDQIHKGHELLLNKAIELSNLYNCLLIVTVTEDCLRVFKSHPVRDYEERVRDLKRYIPTKLNHTRCLFYPYYTNWTEELWQIFQGEKDIIIVCSEETVHSALEVNEQLRDADKYNEQGEHYYPATIVVVPIVRSKDGQKISSTRIRSGEIDLEGNLL